MRNNKTIINKKNKKSKNKRFNVNNDNKNKNIEEFRTKNIINRNNARIELQERIVQMCKQEIDLNPPWLDIKFESKVEKNYKIDANNYSLVKKPAIHSKPNNREFYIRSTSANAGVIKRAKKLFDDNTGSPVIFYGMGAAIGRVCEIAYKLYDIYCGIYSMEIQTGSIEIQDEFIPKKSNEKSVLMNRTNSTITIKFDLRIKK